MSEGQFSRSYHCSQLFGYRSQSEKNIDEDNITALKFDPSGTMLALGDQAGRLIVFKAPDQLGTSPQYDYHFEFQSHEREFDTLNSLQIGEEVNHINWLTPQGKYMKVLTANSNTIKLWKIFQKREKRIVKAAGSNLCIPHLEEEEPTMSFNLKKTFPNRQCCPLNTVNLSRNQQYLFASDESCCLLWSLEQSTRPFLIKEFCCPANRRIEKTQKITCSQLHSEIESLFIFGTNKGMLGLNDTRTSLVNASTLCFSNASKNNHFLSQIINKYSAVMFLEGKGKIVTRDLISLKIWDMRDNTKPLESFDVDQSLKDSLCDLFESDCLDDRFALTNAGGNILSGNYSNSFHLIESQNGQNVQYELDYSQETQKRKVGSRDGRRNNFSHIDKVLSHDFNQVTKQVAVSSHNCFFIFSQQD